MPCTRGKGTHLCAIHTGYHAFVDLEKAFDEVTRERVRWALMKLGVDEWWLIRPVMTLRLARPLKQGLGWAGLGWAGLGWAK